MKARSFVDADGTEIFFEPPENPEYEAIGLGEVRRRIGGAVPGLNPAASEALAEAVMIWAPLPKDLAEDVNRAIFALETAFDFVEKSMPDEDSFWSWREVKARCHPCLC